MKIKKTDLQKILENDEDKLEHYVQSWEYYKMCYKTDTDKIDSEYLKDIQYNMSLYRNYVAKLANEMDISWKDALEKYGKLSNHND